MSLWLGSRPLIIESGQGAILRDIEGREYIDGVSSLWCNALGHRRPEIDAAVRRQLDLIAHSTLLGLASPPSIELAQRLAAVAPAGLEKVFFSDDGATAVEVALKMAYQYWQQGGQPERRLFVSLQNAYHGDTLGAVSVGGIDLFHGVYADLLFPVRRVPSPYCYRCPMGRDRASCSQECLAAAEEAILEAGPRLAAVIVEPMVQGAAGIITMPSGYMRGLAASCREAGALLIADEVATGFGRTGRMFACEWEDVRPDLMAVGKALTGGYLPVAATLTTRQVFEEFLGPGRTFYHGHTFTGNALGCAAGVAALDVMRQEDIPTSLTPAIGRLGDYLQRLRDLPHVGDVRQLGLMAGVELVRDRRTREPFDPALRVGARVCEAMRSRGVLLRPLGDVLVIMPPLTIGLDLLDRLMDVVFAVTAEITPALER
jgi:adenosylmethionine-8-amino-7-oxononanoate aminotransferase